METIDSVEKSLVLGLRSGGGKEGGGESGGAQKEIKEESRKGKHGEKVRRGSERRCSISILIRLLFPIPRSYSRIIARENFERRCSTGFRPTPQNFVTDEPGKSKFHGRDSHQLALLDRFRIGNS